MLAHLRWADERTAAAVDTIPLDATVQRIWSHLLAAEATWLARIEGSDPAVAVWPGLDPAACRALMQRNHRGIDALSSHVASMAEQRVAYLNSRGERFTNTVAEILYHVCMHGMYHRGQVMLKVRDLGGTPEATDLIAYFRLGV